MSSGAIVFSNNNEYYTPKEIVEMFGSFDYDPASNDACAKRLGIPNYDTIETDGLKQDWTQYKRIWINPPFTLKRDFLKKAVDTYRDAKSDIYILLPISYLTTKEFHKIISAVGGGRVYVPDGRIKFINESGESKSPAFGSVIVKIEDKFSLETIHI